MIKFFHAPDNLVLPQTSRYPRILLSGSTAANTQGFIPFSHIYLSSASQLGHLRKAIDQDRRILVMADDAAQWILNHKRCPINLSFRSEGIVKALAESGLQQNDTIKIAVVNGMGRGYGDNVSGLGALQHFHAFLSKKFSTVQIDLLQRNTSTQGQIYTRYALVNETIQLPISVTRFFRYDAYIDLSDLLSIDQFHELPISDFFLHALSLQKRVRLKRSKKTQLNVDQEEVAGIRQTILERAGTKAGKIVLFHPSASTPLRTMPADVGERVVRDILRDSRAVVASCVEPPFSDSRVVDMRDVSTDINRFFDVIAASDAVITVGTVTYHVSGSLGIPTLLIPTVNADVESAKNFASVKCFIDKNTRERISTKHMSKQPQDVEKVAPIWNSLGAKDIAGFLKKIQ